MKRKFIKLITGAISAAALISAVLFEDTGRCGKHFYVS